MHRTFISLLLLMSSAGIFGKYFYNPAPQDWESAQKDCQTRYTDLAVISSIEDIEALMKLTNNTNGQFWIGLRRSKPDSSVWQWSGNVNVSTTFWAVGEPSNKKDENYVFMQNSRFYDSVDVKLSSFCYRMVVVVNEKKTWVEALEHCKKEYETLASVTSRVEAELIWREITNTGIEDPVWIGLRFFPGDGWLWMDKRPLVYEEWKTRKRPDCPGFWMGCAAMTVTYDINYFAYEALGLPTDYYKNGWEAYDCEEKFNFVCF